MLVDIYTSKGLYEKVTFPMFINRERTTIPKSVRVNLVRNSSLSSLSDGE